MKCKKEKPRAEYLSYCSHDCEAHYRCPVCGRSFGSWGTSFYIENHKECCKCPVCDAELETGY